MPLAVGYVRMEHPETGGQAVVSQIAFDLVWESEGWLVIASNPAADPGPPELHAITAAEATELPDPARFDGRIAILEVADSIVTYKSTGAAWEIVSVGLAADGAALALAQSAIDASQAATDAVVVLEATVAALEARVDALEAAASSGLVVRRYTGLAFEARGTLPAGTTVLWANPDDDTQPVAGGDGYVAGVDLSLVTVT